MKKIKLKDISNFYKGQQIAKEIIDVFNKSEHKGDLFDDFIKTNPYFSQVTDNLSDPEQINQRCSNYSRKEKQQNAVLLVKKLKRRTYTRRLKTMLISGLSAASLIVAVVILFPDTAVNPSVRAQNESTDTVLSVPTLILSSGKKINLADDNAIVANDSIIEKKGTQCISLKNHALQDIITYNTIRVPSKYTYTVVLGDGTEVLLNANSELRYPTVFNGDVREVFFKGEALFKVKKDQKSFIVTTLDISIKVYGTEFNVNTTKKDFVETLLISGSLGITTINKKEEIMIKPNQLFVLNTETFDSDVKSVDIENYIIWKDNLFKCDHEKLSVMFEKIGLWYGVEFEYKNQAVKNIPISLKLKRTTKLNDIIKSLETISGAVITKKDETNYVIE